MQCQHFLYFITEIWNGRKGQYVCVIRPKGRRIFHLALEICEGLVPDFAGLTPLCNDFAQYHIPTLHPKLDLKVCFVSIYTAKSLEWHTVYTIAFSFPYEFQEAPRCTIFRVDPLSEFKSLHSRIWLENAIEMYSFHKATQKTFNLAHKIRFNFVHYHAPHLTRDMVAIFMGDRILASSYSIIEEAHGQNILTFWACWLKGMELTSTCRQVGCVSCQNFPWIIKYFSRHFLHCARVLMNSKVRLFVSQWKLCNLFTSCKCHSFRTEENPADFLLHNWMRRTFLQFHSLYIIQGCDIVFFTRKNTNVTFKRNIFHCNLLAS